MISLLSIVVYRGNPNHGLYFFTEEALYLCELCAFLKRTLLSYGDDVYGVTQKVGHLHPF